MNDSSCAFEIIFNTLQQSGNSLSVSTLCTYAGVSRSGYYAFTKQILAYVLSSSLEVDFVLETVNKLISDHGISLHAETIIHSDQGCHYTSYKFINILYDKKLRQSMSRRGNCWDNAPQESFFGHMKDHTMDKLATCSTFTEVQFIVDDYMDYYNNRRYQWHLAKLSPNEYDQFVTTGEYPLDIPNVPDLPATNLIHMSKIRDMNCVYVSKK